MRRSRRAFLAGLIPAATVLSLAACGDGDPRVRITAANTAPPSTAPADAKRAATRAVVPPVLSLPEKPVAQGGMFVLTLTGERIALASVEFLGRQYATVVEGDTFLAIVPVGQAIGSTDQVPPGTYPVTVGYEIQAQSLPRALEGGITVTPSEFRVEILTFTPQVAALLEPSRVEQETAMLKAAYGGFSPVRTWDGVFQRPSTAEISDVYGSRRSYQGGPATGSHAGVDFGANTGAPVVAAAAGRVVQAQMMPVRGNMVIVDHGAGLFTGYCHLSAFAVQPGQEVRTGDPIGAVGATGLVTGPHLHWEVVAGGQHVDGLRWLQA